MSSLSSLTPPNHIELSIAAICPTAPAVIHEVFRADQSFLLAGEGDENDRSRLRPGVGEAVGDTSIAVVPDALSSAP